MMFNSKLIMIGFTITLVAIGSILFLGKKVIGN